ncbi:hypothetical protein Glove_132g44 [Diversispora epigaea]|uniref:Uncharacterized protein n=1 Tax=Diversispora epigaea TaxID=1348612 RepID=A0A397IXS7_9GLOM|nr:hypothetical protein Glove_132g44 [Diversispora epigaea]
MQDNSENQIAGMIPTCHARKCDHLNLTIEIEDSAENNDVTEDDSETSMPKSMSCWSTLKKSQPREDFILVSL